MSKDRDELNSDGFTLEDILAEFGGGRSPGSPGDSVEKAAGDKPSVPKAEAPSPSSPTEGKKPTPQKTAKSQKANSAAQNKKAPATPPSSTGTVVPFPGTEKEKEKESFFTSRFNAIRKKADNYAQHMFEEEGAERAPEVRRAEKYIPGVDVEDTYAPPSPPRRPRRVAPPLPDLGANELFRRYSKGLHVLHLRAVAALLFALCALYLTAAGSVELPLPAFLAAWRVQVIALAALLGAGMLLSVDLLFHSLVRAFRTRLGMDTLAALSCCATLTDALRLLSTAGEDAQRLPFCAVCLVGLTFLLWGSYFKQRGLRLACRTAAAAKEPYIVTLDPGKWNGKSAYVKWSGESTGFGSQIQADDGAQRIFRLTTPVLLAACIAFSLLSSVGQGAPDKLLWCLSATLTSSAAFSGALCCALPWDRLCRRLNKCGAALAGWEGTAGAQTATGLLLTDTDLFPPGAVALNGIKILGNFPPERIVGFTATLIRESGGGLPKLFHDLLRSHGALYRPVSDFRRHEGGGLSGTIRDQQILVGSASFMRLMDVPLSQGINVKNAVFCAVDGELAGIFALNYTLSTPVRTSLADLIHNHVGLILATRDFNLVPAMLRQRFKLPVDRMEFPPVERRVELSDPDQPHSPVLTAVLCREGLFPFSEAVVCARRFRSAVRLSSILASVGATLGVLLAYYLTYISAYTSLTPLSLLAFLLLWTLPVFFISRWVNVD